MHIQIERGRLGLLGLEPQLCLPSGSPQSLCVVRKSVFGKCYCCDGRDLRNFQASCHDPGGARDRDKSFLD